MEHLVFCGSKNYPYFDFLSSLAAISYGYINASTRLDNTTYEVETVGFCLRYCNIGLNFLLQLGSDGFLKILPIYLDGIFNPLLNESAYITEVHHVNGDGNDGGVVYSEMKAIGKLAIYGFRKFLCGEKSLLSNVSGGLPLDIIDSLNIEKVREYHQKYYKMENMVLTVIGTIPHEDVLRIMDKFEHDNGFVKSNFIRPVFEIDPEPFTKNVVEVKVADRSSFGTVKICWKNGGDTVSFI